MVVLVERLFVGELIQFFIIFIAVEAVDQRIKVFLQNRVNWVANMKLKASASFSIQIIIVWSRDNKSVISSKNVLACLSGGIRKEGR